MLKRLPDLHRCVQLHVTVRELHAVEAGGEVEKAAGLASSVSACPRRLVDAGVPQAAMVAVGEEEMVAAVLAALAKRGGGPCAP
jgi:hypothetical protein